MYNVTVSGFRQAVKAEISSLAHLPMDGELVVTLYAVAYALKFKVKQGQSGVDYAVMPSFAKMATSFRGSITRYI